MNREELEQRRDDIELLLCLYDDLEIEGAALDEWERQIASEPQYQKPLPRLKRRTGKPSTASFHIARNRIMLFIIIVILSISLLAGSVSGAITIFYDWIACGCRTAISIRGGDGPPGIEWDWSGRYQPEVPDEYELSDILEGGDTTIFFYTRGAQEFTFWQISGGWGSLQDSEHADAIREVAINGQPGYLFREGETYRLIWGKNPRFTLLGDLTEEELFQIAESVKYVP